MQAHQLLVAQKRPRRRAQNFVKKILQVVQEEQSAQGAEKNIENTVHETRNTIYGFKILLFRVVSCVTCFVYRGA